VEGTSWYKYSYCTTFSLVIHTPRHFNLQRDDTLCDLVLAVSVSRHCAALSPSMPSPHSSRTRTVRGFALLDSTSSAIGPAPTAGRVPLPPNGMKSAASDSDTALRWRTVAVSVSSSAPSWPSSLPSTASAWLTRCPGARWMRSTHARSALSSAAVIAK
jgi:hypothetical protein